MARRIDLGRALAFPVHAKAWQRPAGSRDYRITADWDDPDPINGGEHGACDVGNFRSGDPVRTPSPCRVMALRHFDGALGVRLDLGAGWSLELWHLSVLLSRVGAWEQLGDQALIGRTGASGQGSGAHTHVELKHHGQRVNPERYLLGLAQLVIEEDDNVRLSGAFARHVQGQRASLADGAYFRAGVTAGNDAPLAVMPAGLAFLPVVEVKGKVHGTAPDKASWYGGLNWVSATQADAVESDQSGWLFGYYHSSVLTRTRDGRGVELQPIDETSATLEAAYRAGQAAMRDRARVAAGQAVGILPLDPRP